ncbi:MAG: hypothetical protein ACSHW4_15045 [Cellulophaga sp.]
MFKKKLTSYEIKERMDIFFPELVKQCEEHQCFEFEYYWEMWGVMWMPWFIEINGNNTTFSLNEIGTDDFDFLIANGSIKLIKEYEQEEMKDEFDRKRYAVIKNNS